MDSASLVISVIALLISGVTCYFTLFHKKNSLVAVIASWQSDDELPNSDFRCDLSLGNNGTCDLLIKEVQIDFQKKDEGDLVPEINVPELPKVLKAGELTLLGLNLPKRFMSIGGKMGFRFELSILAYTLDGKLMIAKKTLSPSLDGIPQNDENWKPFVAKKIGN